MRASVPLINSSGSDQVNVEASVRCATCSLTSKYPASEAIFDVVVSGEIAKLRANKQAVFFLGHRS